MRRLMDHEHAESLRVDFGADSSGRKWMGDRNSAANGGGSVSGGGEVFRSTFKPADVRGQPRKRSLVAGRGGSLYYSFAHCSFDNSGGDGVALSACARA